MSSPVEPVASTVVPHLPQVPTGAVRWRTTGTTVAIAALLCLGAYAGTVAFVSAALLATLVLAIGWPRLLALPSPRGTTAVVAVGGAMCVVTVGLARNEPLLSWLSLAMAGAVVAEFVHQLARRDGRPRVVESSTGALVGVSLLASMSTWIALPQSPIGPGGVVATVAPITLALALQLLPMPARTTAAIGTLAAVLVGALLGGMLDGPTRAAGGVAGGLSAVVALMLHQLLAILPPAGWAPGWLALAVSPLAASGIVGYVTLRLLVG